MRRRLDNRPGTPRRIAALENARSDKHAVDANLHHQRRIGRRRDTARREIHDRQTAKFLRLFHQRIRRPDILGIGHQLLIRHQLQAPNLAQDGARVAHGLDHVTRARLAFRADHGRTLANATQRFTQIAAATHKRHLEGVLVDVVILVRRGQDFALVHIVDTNGLENLRLDKVADTRLCHHGNGHRLDNFFDHAGVRHACHATVNADVGRHALERHHSHGTRFFRNHSLVGRDHVHDHAALEHLRQTGLHLEAADFTLAVCTSICTHFLCLQLARCGHFRARYRHHARRH